LRSASSPLYKALWRGRAYHQKSKGRALDLGQQQGSFSLRCRRVPISREAAEVGLCRLPERRENARGDGARTPTGCRKRRKEKIYAQCSVERKGALDSPLAPQFRMALRRLASKLASPRKKCGLPRRNGTGTSRPKIRGGRACRLRTKKRT